MISGGGFYYKKQFAIYKIAARVTLFEKKYLLKMLRVGETPWEFETNGMFRSWLSTKKHLCPNNNFAPVFPYDFDGWSLCMKGSYYKPVLDYFINNENLVFDLNKRKVITEISSTKKTKNKLSKFFFYGFRAFWSLFKKRHR